MENVTMVELKQEGLRAFSQKSLLHVDYNK